MQAIQQYTQTTLVVVVIALASLIVGARGKPRDCILQLFQEANFFLKSDQRSSGQVKYIEQFVK